MADRIRQAADGQRARVGGVWTREKLVYLSKYAAAFMTAMAPKRAQQLWDRLVFIDPLCGPGIDIDGKTDSEFSGSPLIALGIEPLFDHLYLGDSNRRNVAALTRRIPPADALRVSLQQADCHEHVQAVIQRLSRKT